MTRESASRRAKEVLREATETEDAVCYINSEDKEWLETAIKALEQESCEVEKVGRWITQHIIGGRNCEMIVCSNCREEFSYDAETGVPMDYRNYCPNCGAKMQ